MLAALEEKTLEGESYEVDTMYPTQPIKTLNGFSGNRSSINGPI